MSLLVIGVRPKVRAWTRAVARRPMPIPPTVERLVQRFGEGAAVDLEAEGIGHRHLGRRHHVAAAQLGAVEADLLRVLLEVRAVELGLVLEHRVVHLPEALVAALGVGLHRRLGRRRQRVDVGVDGQRVERRKLRGIEVGEIFRVDKLDAAGTEHRLELGEPLRGLVVPAVAEEEHLERLVERLELSHRLQQYLKRPRLPLPQWLWFRYWRRRIERYSG